MISGWGTSMYIWPIPVGGRRLMAWTNQQHEPAAWLSMRMMVSLPVRVLQLPSCVYLQSISWLHGCASHMM
jgi:hypothetical protein